MTRFMIADPKSSIRGPLSPSQMAMPRTYSIQTSHQTYTGSQPLNPDIEWLRPHTSGNGDGSALGSYDAANKVLTIVQFTQPADVTDYVNSMWKIQDNPFGGDAANSYNDGPPSPGAKPLGPFYEIESSSPAAALAPGGSVTHTHRTIHLSGSEAALDTVARTVLGVSLEDIKTALKKP